MSLVFGGCLLVSTTAMAAGQGAVGTFSTPTRSGAVKFVAVKRVVQLNRYQDNMVISGRTFQGVMYGLRDGSGRVGFVWYYPTDYAQAGLAVLALQPDGRYSEQLDFKNRRGVVTESGLMNVKAVFLMEIASKRTIVPCRGMILGSKCFLSKRNVPAAIVLLVRVTDSET